MQSKHLYQFGYKELRVLLAIFQRFYNKKHTRNTHTDARNYATTWWVGHISIGESGLLSSQIKAILNLQSQIIILPMISPQKFTDWNTLTWIVAELSQTPQSVSRRLLSIHVAVKTERLWTFIDAPGGCKLQRCHHSSWLLLTCTLWINVNWDDTKWYNRTSFWNNRPYLFGQPEETSALSSFFKTNQIIKLSSPHFWRSRFVHLQWSCIRHSSTGRL